MTTKMLFPLALAVLITLALPACARSTPSTARADEARAVGVDLGPSSRVPTTRIAMAGAGHEAHTLTQAPGAVQPVHEGGSDAHATGTVNSVDAAQHKINLSHGPIPAIGWPAMTMDFSVAPSVDLSRVKPGSRVNFSLEKDKSGMYQIQSVAPAGAGNQ
jgi:Cu(I)/Ag(I) efflux system protein CusF